jgi:hypothetical protein
MARWNRLQRLTRAGITCAPQRCRPAGVTSDFSGFCRQRGAVQCLRSATSPKASTRGAVRPARISLARAQGFGSPKQEQQPPEAVFDEKTCDLQEVDHALMLPQRSAMSPGLRRGRERDGIFAEHRPAWRAATGYPRAVRTRPSPDSTSEGRRDASACGCSAAMPRSRNSTAEQPGIRGGNAFQYPVVGPAL